LPSLAGVWPKNQFGLLEPKTEAKKKYKKFHDFTKIKIHFLEGKVATTGWGLAQKSVGLF
jgi:hypothetical protein